MRWKLCRAKHGAVRPDRWRARRRTECWHERMSPVGLWDRAGSRVAITTTMLLQAKKATELLGDVARPSPSAPGDLARFPSDLLGISDFRRTGPAGVPIALHGAEQSP